MLNETGRKLKPSQPAASGLAWLGFPSGLMSLPQRQSTRLPPCSWHTVSRTEHTDGYVCARFTCSRRYITMFCNLQESVPQLMGLTGHTGHANPDARHDCGQAVQADPLFKLQATARCSLSANFCLRHVRSTGCWLQFRHDGGHNDAGCVMVSPTTDKD